MIFKEISVESDEYPQAWRLRQRVLREPLGLPLIGLLQKVALCPN